MAHAPSSTRRSTSSQQLVVETIVDDKNPTKLMSATEPASAFSPGPAAARRAGPAGEARGARRGDQEERHSRRRRSTRWRPGRRPSSCSATSSRTWASRAAKASKRCCATASRRKGKPIGELESNVEQLGFFDTLPEKRAARSCSKARSSDPGDMNKDFGGMLDGLVARRRQGDRPDLQPRPRRLARAQQALIKQRNANWSKWIEQRMAQPGRGPDRGRRGPSRGQGFGGRAAARRTVTRSAASNRPPRRRSIRR